MVQRQGDALDKDTIFFIHNVFGSFFANTLDYFSDTLYDRVGFKVVATYDKAVEYCNKKELLGHEADKPLLPALILNPTGTMLPADANAGGKQLWRYPNLAPGLGSQMFDPIYQDANMRITPVFMRFKGDIELIYLVNSFYEYLDLKVHLINHMGGLDRIIYPNFFNSYLILPEDFVTYTYSNEYTGLNYTLDWSSSGATTELIRSTAQNELVLPLRIKPNFTMTDLSDGSTRYGGTDSIADWRLLVTLNYEVEIPTYIVINSNYLVENIKLDVRYGSTYSNQEDAPINRSLTKYKWDWGLDETSNSVLDLQDYTVTDGTTEISITPPPTEIAYQIDLFLNVTYLHEVTAGEADSTANWTITIPPPDYIQGEDYVILMGPYSPMNYGDHYVLGNGGRTIIIKYENVNFIEGDIIEINIYEEVGSSSSTSSSSSSSSTSSSSSSSSTSSSSSSSSSSLSSSSSSSSLSSSSSSSSLSSSSSSTIIQNLYGGTGDLGTLLKWNGVDAWEEMAPHFREAFRISSLITFNGKIYAGTSAGQAGWVGGELFEWNGIDAWTLAAPAIGEDDDAVTSMVEFNGTIYASTFDGLLYEWNGVDAWVEVAPQFEDVERPMSLIVFNSKIYAGTSLGGLLLEWNDVDDWIEVADKLGDQRYIDDMVELNNKLYGVTRSDGHLYEWNGVDAWVEVAPSTGTSTPVQATLLNGKIYCAAEAQLYEWNGVDDWTEVAPEFQSKTEIDTCITFEDKIYASSSKGTLWEWNGVDAWVEVAPQLGSAKLMSMTIL